MAATYTDTSEHQQHPDGTPILIDDTYGRPFAMFRVASEHGRVDAAISGQIHRALDMRMRGKLTNFGGYIIPCVITNALNLQRLDETRFPRDAVVMIDLESWPQPDGTALVSGDHSGQLNDLADAVRARQGGRSDLVWGYGNRGDLDALWPTRPGWLGFIVASYGSVKPSWLPAMVGWQYTNGQIASAARPTSTPPYGRCDHNELYVPVPTAGDDMPLDAADKSWLLAQLATHQDVLTILDGTPSRNNSLKDIRSAQDAYYNDPAHQFSQAAIVARQAQQMAAQVTDGELAGALTAFLPTVTAAVVAAVAGGTVDPDAIAASVVTKIGELLKGATS